MTFRFPSAFLAPLVLIILGLSAAPAAPAPPTEVLVVGTIHGRHRTNANYSFEDLVRILAAFRPDAICVEIRPVDFRRVAYLDEMMMATTYGLKRGLKVYPIDWWDEKIPAREERAAFQKTPEYKAKHALEERMLAESTVAAAFKAKYGDTDSPPGAGYDFYNGPEYNEFIAEMYRISMAVYGDSAMNLYYETRNAAMMGLIRGAIAENRGRRLVVLSGSEHKHYFDRALAADRDVSVVKFSSILPLGPVALDPEIRDLLERRKATLYFDLKTRAGADACYRGALLPLVHGPDMDIYPETVPPVNLEKARALLSEWRSLSPDSTELHFETGWFDFLTGRLTDAVKELEAAVRDIDRIQPAQMRPAVYRALGFCYDLVGERAKALAAYAAGDRSAEALAVPADGRAALGFAAYMAKPYPGIPKRTAADFADEREAAALRPLVHGPDMDFYPEKVPPANLEAAKKILDDWGRRVPASPLWRLESGWYHFLTGAWREAITELEAAAGEIGRITPSRRHVVYRTLGFCYDLVGERPKAVASYRTGRRLAEESGVPAAICVTLYRDYETTPYPGIPKPK